VDLNENTFIRKVEVKLNFFPHCVSWNYNSVDYYVTKSCFSVKPLPFLSCAGNRVLDPYSVCWFAADKTEKYIKSVKLFLWKLRHWKLSFFSFKVEWCMIIWVKIWVVNAAVEANTGTTITKDTSKEIISTSDSN